MTLLALWRPKDILRSLHMVYLKRARDCRDERCCGFRRHAFRSANWCESFNGQDRHDPSSFGHCPDEWIDGSGDVDLELGRKFCYRLALMIRSASRPVREES